MALVDVVFGRLGLKRARLTADTEPLEGCRQEMWSQCNTTDTIENWDAGVLISIFPGVSRFLWHLRIRGGFSWIKMLDNRNHHEILLLSKWKWQYTNIFFPHKEPILSDSRIAIKHPDPLSADIELLVSNILSTSFFSKEMTLLSQTLALVFKAVSFATSAPSSPQVVPALSNKLGCYIMRAPSG